MSIDRTIIGESKKGLVYPSTERLQWSHGVLLTPVPHGFESILPCRSATFPAHAFFTATDAASFETMKASSKVSRVDPLAMATNR